MSGQQRIEVLDVLRGVAILGTLGTNIWIFTSVLGPPGALTPTTPPDTWGHHVELALRFLSNGKFLALLTLLFGVGLELQYQAARRRGAPWPGWYLWRAALLFVEGLLHYLLIFEYDVLMGYAVTALVVAFLIGCGDRAIRWWMGVLGSLYVAGIGLLTAAMLSSPSDGTQGTIRAGRPDLFANGSYAEQFADRINLAATYRSEAILIVPQGIVLFLLGSRLLRAGAFDNSARGARLRTRLMILGFGFGVPLNLVTTFAGHGWFLVDRYLLPPLIALGVLGLVTTLLHRMSGRPGVLRLGLTAIGRTALSCYVGQNLIATVLCYGWGLGLAVTFAPAHPWWVLAAWAGISATLMALAVRWTRRHQRGPLETAWQWAYLAPQRRREPAPVSP